MQSILGALLTAGYASAVATAITAAPASAQDKVTHSVQAQAPEVVRRRGTGGAELPEVLGTDRGGGRTSFVDGSDWAFVAGIVAILLGAVVVFIWFPPP